MLWHATGKLIISVLVWFSRPAKTLKSTFDGIVCYKLAIMLESISIVQGLRKTRLPSRHLTFKVNLQGQKVK